MGKTFRHSPEDDDFGRQNNRVNPRDVYLAHHLATVPLMRLLPPVKKMEVVEPAKPPRPVLRIPHNWIIPEPELRTGYGEHVRASRLDLLHAIGQDILELGLEA